MSAGQVSLTSRSSLAARRRASPERSRRRRPRSTQGRLRIEDDGAEPLASLAALWRGARLNNSADAADHDVASATWIRPSSYALQPQKIIVRFRMGAPAQGDLDLGGVRRQIDEVGRARVPMCHGCWP